MDKLTLRLVHSLTYNYETPKIQLVCIVFRLNSYFEIPKFACGAAFCLLVIQVLENFHDHECVGTKSQLKSDFK